MKTNDDGTTTAPRAARVLSRRAFLRALGVSAAGWIVARCAPTAMPTAQPPATATATAAETATATAAPTATATATAAATHTPSPTGTPAPTATSPPTLAPTDTPAPTATATADLRPRVAIARAETYDPGTISARMREMFDGLGGLGDVVRPGARVAIKTNLTGGTAWQGPGGLSATETFVTHPAVVRALGQLLLDAGAGALFIVEAVYQWGSFVDWGYEAVARDLGATLVDLNGPGPYADYAEVPVPGGGLIYPAFTFNRILHDVDVFVSVSKMKCHWVCGVTHTMKNLVGLVPAHFYRLTDEHSHRSAFHGPSDETAGARVPRIIVDLNRTRPIHLAVIDGVKTTEAGEGPWIQGMRPRSPGVLFASKDPLAADAVATAAMGFDPAAPAMQSPFVRGENHLALAAAAGLGTHHPAAIAVTGTPIAEIRQDFAPCL